MGLFSLFRKTTPEEIYQTLASNLVIQALTFREQLSTSDNITSIDAGAELIYILLHVIDREAFTLLGASKRETVFDEIMLITITDYANACLTDDAPNEISNVLIARMLSTLNARQEIYAQCESLIGDGFPSKGTMVFAFCFYIHRVLGHTERDDLDSVLTGKQEISDSDLDDFPDISDLTNNSIVLAGVISELQIVKHLEAL